MTTDPTFVCEIPGHARCTRDIRDGEFWVTHHPDPAELVKARARLEHVARNDVIPEHLDPINGATIQSDVALLLLESATIPSAGPWTDERIREAFIYDGGEAEYLDPINGAREQRRYAGAIFDRWLAEHDARVRLTQ